MVKKCLLGVVVAVMAVTLVSGSAFAYESTLTVKQDYGTVTYKFTLDTDSNEALGHQHKSSGALKTDWVYVPVGIPFSIFYETRDSDSTASAYYPWGPDTIGLGLETAPVGGLAVDSLTQYKRGKADLLWQLRSVSWTAFTAQHHFDAVYVDSLPNDTAAFDATSLKSNVAFDQATPKVNLGLLRFSVCVDAADSVLDGDLRMNAFIVFKAPEIKEVINFTSPKKTSFNDSGGQPVYSVVERYYAGPVRYSQRARW